MKNIVPHLWSQVKEVKFHHHVKRFYYKNLFRKIYTIAIIGLIGANIFSMIKYASFADESLVNETSTQEQGGVATMTGSVDGHPDIEGEDSNIPSTGAEANTGFSSNDFTELSGTGQTLLHSEGQTGSEVDSSSTTQNDEDGIEGQGNVISNECEKSSEGDETCMDSSSQAPQNDDIDAQNDEKFIPLDKGDTALAEGIGDTQDSSVAVSESQTLTKEQELANARETLNTAPIAKSYEHNKVRVNVKAPVGSFPEKAELVIKPIDRGSVNKVAFDISFIYTYADGSTVELQPKEGTKVQVSFNYEKNEDWLNGINNGGKLKVTHTHDGNKENVDVTDEEEGSLRFDMDKFSEVGVELVGGTDIVIQATATEANQTLKINKYFANDYTVDRGDGSPIAILSEDISHSYSIPGTYNITLSSRNGAPRWTFTNNRGSPLVPKNGTTVTNVKIISMPSLADGFGDRETSPGSYFFSYFNYNGALTSLPAGSFDTSKITTVGVDFFRNFNNNGVLESLPENSFNISNVTTVGDCFFTRFNNNGVLKSLPDKSFNTSNITTVRDSFFSNFNNNGALESLPENSFNTSNITTVGDYFFNSFNQNGALKSLPSGSFDTSNITTVGYDFFSNFNANGAIQNLPNSFTMNSAGASNDGGYYYAFYSPDHPLLNKNVSDLVAGVTPPNNHMYTFSDNQPGRCRVHRNWLVSVENVCSDEECGEGYHGLNNKCIQDGAKYGTYYEDGYIEITDGDKVVYIKDRNQGTSVSAQKIIEIQKLEEEYNMCENIEVLDGIVGGTNNRKSGSQDTDFFGEVSDIIGDEVTTCEEIDEYIDEVTPLSYGDYYYRGNNTGASRNELGVDSSDPRNMRADVSQQAISRGFNGGVLGEDEDNGWIEGNIQDNPCDPEEGEYLPTPEDWKKAMEIWSETKGYDLNIDDYDDYGYIYYDSEFMNDILVPNAGYIKYDYELVAYNQQDDTNKMNLLALLFANPVMAEYQGMWDFVSYIQKGYPYLWSAVDSGHKFGSFDEGDNRYNYRNIDINEYDFDINAKAAPVRCFIDPDHINSVEKYTVTFDTKGGNEAVPAQTVKEGKKLKEPAIPTRDNYTFDGWYTSNGTKWIFDTDTVQSEMTLYAKWRLCGERSIIENNVCNFGIRFDLNGGEGEISAQYVPEGDKVIAPDTIMTKDNYTFDGWYTQNGTKWNFDTDTVNGEMILYAKWRLCGEGFVVENNKCIPEGMELNGVIKVTGELGTMYIRDRNVGVTSDAAVNLLKLDNIDRELDNQCDNQCDGKNDYDKCYNECYSENFVEKVEEELGASYANIDDAYNSLGLEVLKGVLPEKEMEAFTLSMRADEIFAQCEGEDDSEDCIERKMREYINIAFKPEQELVEGDDIELRLIGHFGEDYIDEFNEKYNNGYYWNLIDVQSYGNYYYRGNNSGVNYNDIKFEDPDDWTNVTNMEELIERGFTEGKIGIEGQGWIDGNPNPCDPEKGEYLPTPEDWIDIMEIWGNSKGYHMESDNNEGINSIGIFDDDGYNIWLDFGSDILVPQAGRISGGRFVRASDLWSAENDEDNLGYYHDGSFYYGNKSVSEEIGGNTYAMPVRCFVNPAEIPDVYVVSYETNGGDNDIPDANVIAGDTVILPSPTKANYTFGGWYSDKSLTHKFTSSDIVTSDLTLYAKWTTQQASTPTNGYSGGGGGGKVTKPDTNKNDHGSAETPKSEVTAPIEGGEKNESSDGTKGSTFSKPVLAGSDKVVLDMESYNPSYSYEQNQAYQFAKSYGITTKPAIQDANVNGNLTRIQMAKMLSQYAVNILGKEPDLSNGTVKFADVPQSLDKKYDNGVSVAYLLGIMGQNMKDNRFRPYDEVTRGEFVTAFSRMIYNTSDGKYKSTPEYYTNHINKLSLEQIITKIDPKMKELRGYVMLMLYRSVK